MVWPPAPVWRVLGKQDRRKPALLSRFTHARFRCACRLLLAGLGFAFFAGSAFAVPPATPITNTATVTYAVGGVSFHNSDNEVVITDGSSGNSPPHGVEATPSEIEENLVGGVIGDLVVEDVDPDDVHTQTVSDPRFEINGSTLKLVEGVSLDFEAESEITVSITVTDSDGNILVHPLVISVLDVNERPTDIDLSDTTAPGEPGGLVGDLSTVDPDSGDSHVYSVDDPRFEIAGSELKVVDGELLPPGTVTIVITTTDSGGLTHSETFDLEVLSDAGAPSDIVGLSYASDSPGVDSMSVGRTSCDRGSGFAPLSQPVSAFGDPVPVPGSVELLPTDLIKSGDVLFLSVTDEDANRDSSSIDTVLVELVTEAGDRESLMLAETGIDDSVFAGYVQTGRGLVVGSSCVLELKVGERITAAYTDADDNTDVATFELLVDPFSRVFDSRSGRFINGAEVTLLDAVTGAPARVYEDDGTNSSASTVTSGDPSLVPNDGVYRFPLVPLGDYILAVVPPNRFAFPSAEADEDIQLLPGAPFAMSGGSRGFAFSVQAGPVIQIDIPLDLQPVVPTPSELEVLKFVPGSGSQQSLPETSCLTGDEFVASGDPFVSGQSVSLPGHVPLERSRRFVRGDAVFIRLTDGDQDLDPFAPDHVDIEITVSGQRDRETVRLRETRDSSGVFTGFIQTSGFADSTVNNCVLESDPASEAVVNYSDQDDPSDTSTEGFLLDPGFTVFSSADGNFLDGARVTIVDAASGLPAEGAVFASDRTTRFPTTVISGGSAADELGRTVEFGTGSFFFPHIEPGRYRLEVEPVVSHTFPSVVEDGQLQALPGSPYVLENGSRGLDFEVLGTDPTGFDIPLDPIAAQMFVTKVADKEVGAIGDFVQYRIGVQNSDTAGTVSDLRLVDRLPVGFRYVKDSLRIGGKAGAPQISGTGEDLVIHLDNLANGEDVEVRYVVEISAGAERGAARNEATVEGTGVGSSNVAFADVLVRDDLFASRSFLVGQVWDGACPSGETPSLDRRGLAGVRVWLEDGTFVVTDQEGKYHFEGVESGTHILQLDAATLPEGYAAIPCEQNTRFAGESGSQFVDVQPGTLWRADFYVSPPPPAEYKLDTRLDAVRSGERVDYTYELNIENDSDMPVSDVVVTVMLPEGVQYQPGTSSFAGEALADPAGAEMGALSFRLRDPGAGHHQLSFSTSTHTEQQEDLTARGVVQMQVAGQRQRSPVSVNVAGTDTSAAGTTQSFVVEGPEPREVESQLPYEIPERDRGARPPMDIRWLEENAHRVGFVWPPERYNPTMPAIPVSVVHPSDVRPQLIVDGELVSPLTLEGTIRSPGQGISLTHWDNVPISERDSVIEAQFMDRDGARVDRYTRDVHYSGAPARAELVEERSYLKADGIHPPLLAIRLYDRAGYPLRAGTTGDFSVPAPYEPLDKAKHLENSRSEFANRRYTILRDGVAYIQLEPTVATGEVEVRFQFDQVRDQRVRARLEPGQREWIMVGLVEGTLGRLSRHIEETGVRTDETLTDGRVAFYAKGEVRGDYLLTISYDTDKKFERSLREQIDPNQYYTLYGDGTSQLHDAQSQRKLYLKVEKERFVTLFGDFDTGFQRSELARYERRMNGISSGYYGRRAEVSGFVSETDQGFIRDELRGDGTSGVYRLTRDRLVRNSESVRIVTRDRFSPDRIINERVLTRHLDYTIDFDRGQLFFKQPVFSQDENFNPVFIDVEYEVGGDGRSDELIAGVRAAYRLDEQDSEAAVTYIDDSSPSVGGTLTGADFTWQYDERNKITLEVARSQTEARGGAGAYIAQYEHRDEVLAGRIYVREQEAGFGLGHQTTLDDGVRRVGIEGEYRVGDGTILHSHAYEQTVLDTGAKRTVLDVEGVRQIDRSTWSAGLRGAVEELETGEKMRTTQLLLGATQSRLDNRLVLRSDLELDIGSDSEGGDFPSRSVFGGEYEIMQDVRLVAEQEFSWSDSRDTRDTRFGLRARPWTGADVSNTVTRQQGENGDRLFATTGLLQQWRVSDDWLVDAGLDRVQTLKSDGASTNPGSQIFNPAQPPAFGSFDQDFTAMFAGVAYNQENWGATARIEHHQGDLADKWNFLLGADRQLGEGRVVSSSISYFSEETGDGARNTSGDLRVGLAWRPAESGWTFLHRSDLILLERDDDLFASRSRKWVTNTHANYKGEKHQLAFNLGIKFILDTIDGDEYDGWTMLYGAEYRRDIFKRMDFGAHATARQSLRSNVRQFSAGVSAGFNVMPGAWLSVGYNFVGFQDDDFIGAEYTARGPYLKIRMKFDDALAHRFLKMTRLAKTDVPDPERIASVEGQHR